MLIAVAVLFISVLILLGVLLLLSPGTPKPFLDDSGKPLAGSISEKIRVDINGVEQGMFIKSKNARNPVLLYLHGGIPDYFLMERYPTGLDETFTVVWWKQRGSGLSYRPDIPPENVNDVFASGPSNNGLQLKPDALAVILMGGVFEKCSVGITKV
jgi:hypothetical protein